MHSLVFLCAQKLASHHATARGALEVLPTELYPVLFKAAFLDKRTLVLQDLVQTWPFPVLSFQRLLRRCQHCDRAPLQEKPSKLCVQTVILGVVAYLGAALEGRSHSSGYVGRQGLGASQGLRRGRSARRGGGEPWPGCVSQSRPLAW